MKQLVENLEKWNFRVCAVFLIDAQFLVDTPKFFSGVLAALSVMVTLETSHVNIMSKVDLLDKNDKNELQKYLRKKFFFFNLILILLNIKRYLEPDLDLLNDDNESLIYRKKFHKLNKAIARVIDDYSLVKFQPLDVSDEDSINDVLLVIDNILQYGEENDVKEPKEVEENVEPDENNKEIE
jgi:hypothetical protein